MARKRTRTEPEVETSNSERNMNEEEVEVSSSNMNVDETQSVPGGLVRVELNKPVNALLFRLKPEQFANIMEYLNGKQKRDIVELGFGALLNFKLNYIPPKLGFWLASYFNPIACGLPIGGRGTNCKHIDEVDVHLTLGLPKGRHPIERRTKQDDVSWMQAIAESLNKPRKHIKIDDIAILMLEEADGGDQFKRLFLVLMEYCFIETPGDGCVIPKILHFLDDLSVIHDYNWCGYVINVLLEVHNRWVKNSSRYYTGPILFLVGCYVDRMIVGRRTIERRFPTISMWELESLKGREAREISAGGFGLGYYDDRMPQQDVDNDKLLIKEQEQQIMDETNEMDGPSISTKRKQQVNKEREAKKATDEVYEAGVLLANGIFNFAEKLKAPPKHIRELNCFKVASSAGLILLNQGREENSQLQKEEQIESLAQNLSDEDLQNPEWLEAIEKMMSALDKKIELENYMPNWNLFDDDDGSRIGGDDGFTDMERDVHRTTKSGQEPGGPSRRGKEPADQSREKEKMSAATKEPSQASGSLSPAATAARKEPSKATESSNPAATDARKEPSKATESSNPAATDAMKEPSQATESSKPTAAAATNEPSKDKNDSTSAATEKVFKEPSKPPQQVKNAASKKTQKAETQNVGQSGSSAERSKVDAAPKLNYPCKEKGEEETKTISTRNRSKQKVSDAIKSPYAVRALTMSYKLTPEERELYYWMLSTENNATELIVFNINDFKITHAQLMSMLPYARVHVAVIDAWCCYLNLNENFKSRTSPNRLFLTTFPCSGTVVDPKTDWGYDQTKEVFQERMIDELKYIDNFKWENYNLVFFPIYANNHYYVVCFDFLKTTINVIDNVRSEADVVDTYGDQINRLTDFFIHTLEKCSCSSYGRMAQKAKLNILELKWSTKDDTTDCGLYVMRHIETYMGTKVTDWKCDLTTKQSKSLQLLRAKYCKVMLYNKDNRAFRCVSRLASHQFEEAKKRGPIDVEKMVAEYNKV